MAEIGELTTATRSLEPIGCLGSRQHVALKLHRSADSQPDRPRSFGGCNRPVAPCNGNQSPAVSSPRAAAELFSVVIYEVA